MQLNKQAIDRIRAASFDGPKTADLLTLIAASAEAAGVGSGRLTLDYQLPGDTIERGDLIPVLTFEIRPATYPESLVQESVRNMVTSEPEAAQ